MCDHAIDLAHGQVRKFLPGEPAELRGGEGFGFSFRVPADKGVKGYLEMRVGMFVNAEGFSNLDPDVQLLADLTPDAFLQAFSRLLFPARELP